MSREVYIKVEVLGNETGASFDLLHTARTEASGGVKINGATLLRPSPELDALLSGSYYTINDESATEFYLESLGGTCESEGYEVLTIPTPITPDPIAPLVEIPSTLHTSTTAITVYGNILNLYGYNVTEKGFYIGISPTRTSNTKYVVTGNEMNFEKSLSSLVPDTTYYAWTFAKNTENQISYSESIEVNIPATPSAAKPCQMYPEGIAVVTGYTSGSVTVEFTPTEDHGLGYSSLQAIANNWPDYVTATFTPSHPGLGVMATAVITDPVEMVPGATYSIYVLFNHTHGCYNFIRDAANREVTLPL